MGLGCGGGSTGWVQGVVEGLQGGSRVWWRVFRVQGVVEGLQGPGCGGGSSGWVQGVVEGLQGGSRV